MKKSRELLFRCLVFIVCIVIHLSVLSSSTDGLLNELAENQQKKIALQKEIEDLQKEQQKNEQRQRQVSDGLEKYKKQTDATPDGVARVEKRLDEIKKSVEQNKKDAQELEKNVQALNDQIAFITKSLSLLIDTKGAGSDIQKKTNESLIQEVVQRLGQQAVLQRELESAQKAQRENENKLSLEKSRLEQIATEYSSDSSEYTKQEASYDAREKDFLKSKELVDSLGKSLEQLTRQIEQARKQLAQQNQGRSLGEEQQLVYRLELQRKMFGKSSQEIADVLQSELRAIKKKLFYDAQKDDLEVLISEAGEKGFKDIVDSAQKRVDQIEQFEKNQPPAPRNELEKKLGLQDKIEDDRYEAIITNLFDLLKQLDILQDDALVNEKSLTALTQQLDLLKGALVHYTSDSYQEEKEYILSLINDLKLRPLALVQEARQEYRLAAQKNIQWLTMAQEALSLKGSPDTFNKYAVLTANALSQNILEGIRWTLDQADFYGTLKKMGEGTKQNAELLKKWGTVMTKIPAITQKVLRFLPKAQRLVNEGFIAGKEGAGIVRKIAEIVPGESARKAAEKAKQVAKDVAIAQKVFNVIFENAPKVVQKPADVVGKVGSMVLGVADLIDWFGQTLDYIARQEVKSSQRNQDKDLQEAVITFAVENAQDLIEIERAQLALGSSEGISTGAVDKQGKKIRRYQELYEAFKAFFKELAQDLVTLFKRKEPELTQLISDHEKNRKAYLKALAFTDDEIQEGISEDALAKRLKDFSWSTKKVAEITGYHEKFMESFDALLQACQEMTDQLLVTKANLAFLVNTFDAVKIDQTVSVDNFATNPRYALATMVEGVIQARDMRMAFLDAARNGIDILRENLQEIESRETGLIANQFGTELARMISGALLDEIIQSAKTADAMDKSLKNFEVIINEQFAPGQPPLKSKIK